MGKYKVVTICTSSNVEHCCNNLHGKGYNVISIIHDGIKFVITGKRKEQKPRLDLRGPGMP